ncbi:MAG: 1,4-alpha-glucan branching protein GlgB [Segniliparus sp.]|uniref:1,4-alpha-glucan branching protein GlgB n=1 Tax=Segniliparus sp. TaxID=2804064 RepID=UPI003F32FB95
MSTHFTHVEPAKQKPVSGPARIPDHDFARLLEGSHYNPHGVYGAHPTGSGWTIRAVRPLAHSVSAVFADGSEASLDHLGHGVFGAYIPLFDLPYYRLRVQYDDGNEVLGDDGYRFEPTLGELDLHLIGEGRHERLWEALGAHPVVFGQVAGTAFRVWAPNAKGVAVVGDFNGWNPHAAPMRSLGSSGVWEVFLPDVGIGAKYKYRVLGADGAARLKADPLAFQTELPPQTASVVAKSVFAWTDQEWTARRAGRRPAEEPMAVYEVHLGSFAQSDDGGRLCYRELAERVADHASGLGFTHVELLPVAEHPFGGSWGYQVTSYFAPTSRFGAPDDFRAFVDHLHSRGLGVIVDWVPAHFPKDDWALARFDGAPLYEHPDPRRGEQPDWGTYVFDFGRHEVRNFLVANALYWFEEFHIDGLRVDAVASMLYLDYSRPDGEWEPNPYGGRENLDAVQFLQELNATVHKHHPGVVTIAEESTAWPGVTRLTSLGGLGFNMKWNMGWMHDSLRYFGHDPIHRMYHHNEITFSLMYAWSENYVLPISHDEVVHGKGTLWSRMPGPSHDKAAGVRSYLAYMWAHPGKKLLFMGQEFGQRAEWSADKGLDWWQLDGWEGELHRGILALVRDIGPVYREHPALWSLDASPAGFEWIDANDAQNNVLSFLRISSDGDKLACVVNLSGSDLSSYRVGLPDAGEWVEVLNTDAELYAGSGNGNLGSVTADAQPWHGRPASAQISIAKLSAIWLVPKR